MPDYNIQQILYDSNNAPLIGDQDTLSRLEKLLEESPPFYLQNYGSKIRTGLQSFLNATDNTHMPDDNALRQCINVHYPEKVAISELGSYTKKDFTGLLQAVKMNAPISTLILNGPPNGYANRSVEGLLYPKEIAKESMMLLDALKNNSSITTLEIDFVGAFKEAELEGLDAAIQIFSEALQENTSIKNLNVTSPGPRDQSLSVTRALKNNRSIHTVTLESHIDTEIVSALADFIKNDTSITNFNLDPTFYQQGIQINAEERKQLVDAINHNKSVTLHLKGKERLGISDIDCLETMYSASSRIQFSHIPLDDAISDYSKAILAPKLLQFLTDDTDISPASKNQCDLPSYLPRLNAITLQHLRQGLDDNGIKAFSDHWHESLQQVKSLRDKDYNGIEWKPLLGADPIPIPATITGSEGWRVVSRVTADALKEEGRQLDHCVGGYSGKCITENTHILSLESDSQQSTVEIITDYEQKTCRVNQHYGKKNSEIKKESPNHKALEWLLAEIDKGSLTIDYEALSAAHAARNDVHSLEEKSVFFLGFNALDKTKVRAVAETYRDMLPGNQQLKDNFNALKALTNIDLGSDAIEGKSIFTAQQQAPKLKQPVPQLSSDKILENIQVSLDTLFGRNNVTATIRYSENKRYGEVMICRQTSCPIGVDGIKSRLQSGNKLAIEKGDNSGTLCIKTQPLPLMQILKKEAEQPALLHRNAAREPMR